ncbi:MAG: signal peptidase II [Planctomycetota bacterium]
MSAPESTPPRTSLRGKAWFWVPVPLLVALDLWSKAAAFAYVAATPPRQGRVPTGLLPAPFGFDLVQLNNTGTIWGLGQSLTVPLIALRLLAVAALIWFAARTPPRRRFTLLVIGLVLAGAVGNLYDNLFMAGRGVRDFLLFYYRGEGGVEHVFPAFNVADSCITVGAIALAWTLWREPSAERKVVSKEATS